MPVKRALVAYQDEQLNCAQSVLRAFQPQHGIAETEIHQARRLGGGRAEGGLCGALYAALRLAGPQADSQRLRADFVAAAGAEKCREIRRAARLSCAECVHLAASLLADQGRTANPPSIPATERQP